MKKRAFMYLMSVMLLSASVQLPVNTYAAEDVVDDVVIEESDFTKEQLTEITAAETELSDDTVDTEDAAAEDAAADMENEPQTADETAEACVSENAAAEGIVDDSLEAFDTVSENAADDSAVAEEFDDGDMQAFAVAPSAVLNINWGNIAAVGNQAKGSQSCACFAQAYCRTILDGRVHAWHEYNYNKNQDQNSALATWSGLSNCHSTNAQTVYRAMYDQINAGKPVIILVKGNGSTHHYISVVGYKGVSNPDSLSTSNFYFIDSVQGSTKSQLQVMSSRGYVLKLNGSNQYQYLTHKSGSVSVSYPDGMGVNAPTISNVKVSAKSSAGGYYIVTGDVRAEGGIARIQCPTWTTYNGQDDIFSNWWSNSAASAAVSDKGGGNYSFSYTVYTKDHNYEKGDYATHVYVYDKCGNEASSDRPGIVNMSCPSPDASCSIKSIDKKNGTYTVSFKFRVYGPQGNVAFPTWTIKNGQDDMKNPWGTNSLYQGRCISRSGNLSYTDCVYEYDVKMSDHNYERSNYITHCYVWDVYGQEGFASTGYVNLDEEKPTPEPTKVPTTVPTPEPTKVPTTVPTPEPTPEPTKVPTTVPVKIPDEIIDDDDDEYDDNDDDDDDDDELEVYDISKAKVVKGSWQNKIIWDEEMGLAEGVTQDETLPLLQIKTDDEIIYLDSDDYEISYYNNKKAGTATAVFKGINGNTGVYIRKFKIQAISFSANSEYVDAEIEDNSVKAVFFNDLELTNGRDYTVYYKYVRNKYTGEKTLKAIIVKGKGFFKGGIKIPCI